MLKNDLQALNNVQLVDLAGLSITITALSNNIENLPLLTPDPKTHKITQTEEPKENWLPSIILQYFFETFIDSNTSFLDLNCHEGDSTRIAYDLGAINAVGLVGKKNE